MAEPAYTRLNVDERRRRLLEAGSALFAERAADDISMRQIAEAAGVSKALLYHYFPSKTDLFRAAFAEQSAELAGILEAVEGANPAEQLTNVLDAYLAWIEGNAKIWPRLIQTASTLPEAEELVGGFRAASRDRIVQGLTGGGTPPPLLRTALEGWLAYIDAAILDWLAHRDLAREELRNLLLAAFAASLAASGHADLLA